jgi:hypothetical protein
MKKNQKLNFCGDVARRVSTILLSALLLFCPSALIAQRANKPAHEFSAYASGGFANYHFKGSPKKTSSVGFGTDIGFGFTGFVGHQVGFHAGAGFGLYNIRSKTPDLQSITSPLFDHEYGLSYDLHSTLMGYTEIYKTMYVSIPVMFQFQTRQKQYLNWRRSQKAGFYAQGGIKVLFLIENKFETRLDTMQNWAYYPNEKNWAKTQKFKGFGSFEGTTNAGNMNFGVMVMASLEVGVKWRVTSNFFIYTGGFFDCALNDPMKDNREPYQKYHDPLRGDLEHIPLLSFMEKANLMSVGVKLRFAFTRYQRPY